MAISPSDVRTLREKTGAGMMDCKKALEESNGDFEKAVEYLRKKGLAAAVKKMSRVAAEGLIGTYSHNGKIGVIVEVNCETDFVAKNDDFQNFVKDVAIHIAAANPQFLRATDMDQAFIEKEKEIYTVQLKEQGKPDAAIPKILEGKLKKLSQEVCLYEQAFVKDPDKTITGLLNELTLKLGEKIEIRRYSRFMVGEGIEKKQDNLAEEVAKLGGQA
jgi:elongation factor Ts